MRKASSKELKSLLAQGTDALKVLAKTSEVVDRFDNFQLIKTIDKNMKWKIINPDGSVPSTTKELENILMAALHQCSVNEEPLDRDEMIIDEFLNRPEEFSLEAVDQIVLNLLKSIYTS